jgi:hypothetical protein
MRLKVRNARNAIQFIRCPHGDSMTDSPDPLVFQPEPDRLSLVPNSGDSPIRQDLNLSALEWCDSDR